MQQPFLPMAFRPATPTVETKGVVYTKAWVVSLLLDLAGYVEAGNLVDLTAIEPAAGEGAFLIPMALRLVASCLRQDRPLADCARSLIAYELDEASAQVAREAVCDALKQAGVAKAVAASLTDSWIRVGDYLFDAPRLPGADFVVGNPPYVRLEDIPAETAGLYRDAYPTMRGRADLYVAFFEAALRQLNPDGVCAFICADRWMLNQYGAELRRFVTSGFGVETVVEMHNADAFDDEVSAYPAITVIRRGRQSRAVVASAGSEAELLNGTLAAILKSSAGSSLANPPKGLKAAVVDSWFTGSDPWPCSSPGQLALLRRLEDAFQPLESESTDTRVGIGVATGLDQVYITKEAKGVEGSRLLPLAMAPDTVTGHFRWSGHYLVNPWDADGLVELKRYPKLAAYFEKHRDKISRRNTAQRNPNGWFRTIDRVNPALTAKAKLYIPDIKNVFNPVLDAGTTYPHHNLYFISSGRWDLEVLGGLLLSSVAQLFIEAYGVRMRGGYLRFQAQYLRRVRVPNPDAIDGKQAELLRKAFRARNRELATELALAIYHIERGELERAH